MIAPSAKPARLRAVCVRTSESASESKPIVCVPGMKPARKLATGTSRLYSDSTARFKKIAADAGADIYLSNHTAFDGTKEALPKLAARKPGDPNPLIVGKESVQRYMTLVGECAKAGALKAR